MLKIISIGIIFCASTYIGFYYGEKFKGRYRDLNDILNSLLILNNEVIYGNTPVPQALHYVSQKTSCHLRNLLLSNHLIATLRKENASHAFIGAPAQSPVVPPQQAPWPTPAPPPRECIPDAQNTAGARAGFDVFIASARCTGGVPQATLSMTIATWSKASGWTTRVKPTVSYTSPTTIRYPQSYLVDPAQAADGWALARVCSEAGLTTVCRDDYAYLRGGHSQPPVLR